MLGWGSTVLRRGRFNGIHQAGVVQFLRRGRFGAENGEI